jgi:Domain of unknown function (DUF397)
MHTPKPSTPSSLNVAVWRKSSYSGTQGNCVQVATNLRRIVAVRDSKHPDGALLAVSRTAWAAFVADIQSGQLEA